RGVRDRGPHRGPDPRAARAADHRPEPVAVDPAVSGSDLPDPVRALRAGAGGAGAVLPQRVRPQPVAADRSRCAPSGKGPGLGRGPGAADRHPGTGALPRGPGTGDHRGGAGLGAGGELVDHSVLILAALKNGVLEEVIVVGYL